MNDKKVSCLFGEHLLNVYRTNPIALVEAPKSAIYGSLYFGLPKVPERLLWLGVYNLSSLNYEKCKELKGRDVYLFQYLSKEGGAHNNSKEKARELEKDLPGTRFIISKLLEDHANNEQREQGLDIADFLIKFDWRIFRSEFNLKSDSIAIAGNNSGLVENSENSEKGEPIEQTNISEQFN